MELKLYGAKGIGLDKLGLENGELWLVPKLGPEEVKDKLGPELGLELKLKLGLLLHDENGEFEPEPGPDEAEDKLGLELELGELGLGLELNELEVEGGSNVGAMVDSAIVCNCDKGGRQLQQLQN